MQSVTTNLITCRAPTIPIPHDQSAMEVEVDVYFIKYGGFKVYHDCSKGNPCNANSKHYLTYSNQETPIVTNISPTTGLQVGDIVSVTLDQTYQKVIIYFGEVQVFDSEDIKHGQTVFHQCLSISNTLRSLSTLI